MDILPGFFASPYDVCSHLVLVQQRVLLFLHLGIKSTLRVVSGKEEIPLVLTHYRHTVRINF